jgi:6-phosphogluconate dehydrogenase
MQFGIVGLGPRGAGTARQLMRGGHECVAYDRDPERVSRLALQGAVRARSIAELAGNLQPPRVVLLMLPAGEPTADALLQLAEDFKDGDITVDAGNACYQDDLLRRDRLGEHGIEHVDCGMPVEIMPGGIMLGGCEETVDYLAPILHTLAPGKCAGCVHCGSSGAGHFVNGVYNRIQNGAFEDRAMESFVEEFDLLNHADTFGYEVPLDDITDLWRHLDMIPSRLRDLTGHAIPLSEDVIGSLYKRLRAESNRRFAEKTLTAIRLAMGGDGL